MSCTFYTDIWDIWIESVQSIVFVLGRKFFFPFIFCNIHLEIINPSQSFDLLSL